MFGPFGPRSITDASTLPSEPSRSDVAPRVSNQGLRRLSRSLKTLCGLNVDTGQLWSAFEHILPLNQFKRLILMSNPTLRRSRNLLKLFSIAKLQYFFV